MSHEWAKKAVEHKLYSMREVHEAEKQARAEVLAACKTIVKTLLPQLNSLGMLSSRWLLEEILRKMGELQPATTDLEALLREAKLDSLYWCRRNLDTYDHGEGIPYAAVELRHKLDRRIAELEKAHAILEKKV